MSQADDQASSDPPPHAHYGTPVDAAGEPDRSRLAAAPTELLDADLDTLAAASYAQLAPDSDYEACRRRRSIMHLLRWLSRFPGDTWRARWVASGLDAGGTPWPDEPDAPTRSGGPRGGRLLSSLSTTDHTQIGVPRSLPRSPFSWQLGRLHVDARGAGSAGDAVLVSGAVQPVVHHARHGHDLLVCHAVRVRLRQSGDAVADRFAGCGVPPAERPPQRLGGSRGEATGRGGEGDPGARPHG